MISLLHVPVSAIGRDARGQALTEFAIVIPVVLLLFLGTLQYLQVFRASQHVNYAAFVAARSYAVHASVDGSKRAEKLALDAAALALAPVGRPVPGEFLGLGSLSAGGPRIFALLEGFLVARYIRLDPRIGGGSLEIQLRQHAAGAPGQVDVEINYPQPIFVPGLAELWSWVGRGFRDRADLADLHEGLSGPMTIPDEILEAMPGELEELLPGITEQARNAIHGLAGHLLYPYVNVPGKVLRRLFRLGPEERPVLRALPASASGAAECPIHRDRIRSGP